MQVMYPRIGRKVSLPIWMVTVQSWCLLSGVVPGVSDYCYDYTHRLASTIWIVLDPGESQSELTFEWWPNHRYRESLAFVLVNLCLGKYEVKSVRGVGKPLIGNIRLPLAASKMS